MKKTSKINCTFCNQLINPYYAKRHEKTAKCLKQRTSKEPIANIVDNEKEHEKNAKESRKIACQFCGQEVSPKSIRRHESSIKCLSLRNLETTVISIKRNSNSEELSNLSKRRKI